MGAAKLPAPAKIGLPAKYGNWRSGQSEAVLRVMDASRRFVVLGMPTGFGKSLTYMAVARGLESAAVLTSTKGLQSQLMTDFGVPGGGFLVDIRGMGNYPCLLRQEEGANDVACDEGPCLAGMECSYQGSKCYYFDAQRLAKRSPVLVTNYSYWMHANSTDREDGERPLGKRDLLILDEAHNAVDEIGNFLGVEVGTWEIDRVLQADWPTDTHPTMETWRLWAADLEVKARDIMDTMTGQVKMGLVSKREMSKFRELRDLTRRLACIATVKGEWVKEEARDRRGRQCVRFNPVWPGDYAESVLFLQARQVVLVSATVRPKTLELLGIPTEEYEFHEYPSSFPISRRPVLWLPTIRVSSKSEPGHLRVWAAKIAAIIRKQGQVKGIIHTVSYARRDFLLKYLSSVDLGGDVAIYTHETRELQDTVRDFKKATGAAVLLSPSVSTGFDFPYDECRYQIIAKVPFPDTRDAVMQARSARDKDYFAYITMQQIVQMAGRGMRSADDACATFIVDDQWSWFRQKYKSFAPKWFIDACGRSDAIPQAISH